MCHTSSGPKSLWGRHVRWRAARRIGIDPSQHCGDLVVGEREVVLVVPNADRLVQMPGRHLPVRHPLAHRPRPRPHLFVGDQRHRSTRACVMALRALGLEDRCDVFRVGDGRRCGRAFVALATHVNGDVLVGPAAVIAEVTGRLARPVIHDGDERVVARLAEPDRHVSRAVANGLNRRGDGNGSRPTIFHPLHCHADGYSAPLGQPVVRRVDTHNRRLADRHARRGRRDGHLRRCIGVDVLAVAAACRANAIDLPHAVQRGRDHFCLAAHRERPEQLRVGAEVLRHDNSEHVLVTPRIEVRRLSAIGPGSNRLSGPTGTSSPSS